MGSWAVLFVYKAAWRSMREATLYSLSLMIRRQARYLHNRAMASIKSAVTKQKLNVAKPRGVGGARRLLRGRFTQ